MPASVASDRSRADGDDTNTAVALMAEQRRLLRERRADAATHADDTAKSDDPKAPHGSAAAQDALVNAVVEDSEQRLSVSERLKLLKERKKVKKEDENAEATQAPKRTSTSIADKIAKMHGSGSGDAPPPPPVERSKVSSKMSGGIAERIAKLQAGAGDGATAPPCSPASAHDRSGSGTASRRATVAGGASGTGGDIAAHTQKLGGRAGIVLPGAFEAPHSVTVTCDPARTSLCSEHKRA